MPIKFEWDESYSVGREDLDRQHKRMFDLANSLSEDLDEKHIKRIIMDMYKHTREHFDAEEKMMREIGYPKREEHMELHEELITKLNDISVQHFRGAESVFVFKKFIYDWVIDHILHHDMDYFRFVQQK